MIPSDRVFRRDGTEGEYLLMHYGDVTLRVRRTLWQEVSPEGFEIGDWVEVLSRGMRNEPRTGVIREMLWDERGASDPLPDFRKRPADRATCTRATICGTSSRYKTLVPTLCVGTSTRSG